MVNKLIIVGRVGKKPETHQVGEGQVCNFSVATNQVWHDKSGQKQESTTWHRVVVWGRQAAACAEHLDKGSLAYVEGPLEIREFTDKQGAQQRITELRARDVRFLTGRREGAGHSERRPEVFKKPVPSPEYDNRYTHMGVSSHEIDPNEDIPF